MADQFSEVHAQIDWSRGYESLDKEFQQVVREAEVGRRYVDKLVKVWTTNGCQPKASSEEAPYRTAAGSNDG